jgi:transposase
MTRLFWLSDEAWAAIDRHLPRGKPGKPRVDDRRVISGILIDLARTWTQAALQEQRCSSLSILSSPSAKGTHHAFHGVLH